MCEEQKNKDALNSISTKWQHHQWAFLESCHQAIQQERPNSSAET